MDWATISDGLNKTCIEAFKTSTPATYSPASGAASYSLSGIFDRDHEPVEPTVGFSVGTYKVTFFVRLADMAAAPVRGDKLSLAAGNFKVIDIQEDGQGGAKLVLHKA